MAHVVVRVGDNLIESAITRRSAEELQLKNPLRAVHDPRQWGKARRADHPRRCFPAWSHDGKYVYFSSTAEGEPAFYRVQIKDHKLERVASLKDVRRPTSGTFASWTGLTPDDSPLALRDISNYEIYALDWSCRSL